MPCGYNVSSARGRFSDSGMSVDTSPILAAVTAREGGVGACSMPYHLPTIASIVDQRARTKGMRGSKVI